MSKRVHTAIIEAVFGEKGATRFVIRQSEYKDGEFTDPWTDAHDLLFFWNGDAPEGQFIRLDTEKTASEIEQVLMGIKEQSLASHPTIVQLIEGILT